MTTPRTMRTCAVSFLAGVLAFAATEGRASAQTGKRSLALYAPSVGFKNSQTRLAYVQGLAKSIGTATGQSVEGRAYVDVDDLIKAKPDYAIVEGLCLATRDLGNVVAAASIDGKTSLTWALFVMNPADKVDSLRGKAIAFVKTGCRDRDFLDNAMFESEVASESFFGKQLPKPDITGAVATVRDFKQAEAVFAPTSQAKGLSEVFGAKNIPTPGFVILNGELGSDEVDKVRSAVLSYSAGGGVDGWKAAKKSAYAGLAQKLRRQAKELVFARPDTVAFDVRDVLLAPDLKYEAAGVGQHFWEPRGD